jgi:hypothetical protein
MITGDHLNIAKETARLIGMNVNIHPGESTRDATQERNELIRHANGFAQVLPRDKREVSATATATTTATTSAKEEDYLMSFLFPPCTTICKDCQLTNPNPNPKPNFS